MEADGGDRTKRQSRKRGAVAEFVRTMPIAVAAIGLGIVYLIVVATVPDRGDGVRLLGYGGPVVLLAVVGAVAFDYLRKRTRARLDRSARMSARRTAKLRRELQRTRKSVNAMRKRGRAKQQAARLATEALTSAADKLKSDVASLTVETASLRASAAKAEERMAALVHSTEAQLSSMRQGHDADRSANIASMDDLKTLVGMNGQNGLSLDIVSALLQLRKLLLPEHIAAGVADDRTGEHGYQDLMAALVKQAVDEPGSLAGKTLVEVGAGTSRDRADEGSTQKLALFTAMLGMRFVSVDMDPKTTGRVGPILKLLNPNASAVTAKGEDFLGTAEAPIEFVYLDGFDRDDEGHPRAQRESYRQNLGVAIVDEACWLMHLQCAYAIAARMDDGGLVSIDDTWTDKDGEIDGKGRLAVPFLLSKGFEIVSRSSRALTLRRMSGGGSNGSHGELVQALSPALQPPAERDEK